MPDMNAGVTGTYKVNSDDRLLYTGHVSNNPDWQFPSHKHDDLFEILVIKEGEGQFTIGDIEYDAAEGDVLIYNKGILHAEKSSKDKPIYICYCGFHSTKEWIIPPDRDPVIRANSYSAEMITLMELLFEESTIRDEGHEQICQHLLQSILLLVSRMLSKQTRSPDTGRQQIILDIKEYIDMNYTQPLTLKKMADHFNISPYYFAHLFKNRYSTSPIHYMIQRRMGEATRLLVQTEMKVWEIAKLTGYENANYFSILFTKVVGMSPRQYRDNHKKTLSYPSRE
ncbi:helix-turn-helix domain-containing protein [Paenibacillus gallinarum]|uniref:Helix-turn-helix transcriptional regulator n=1 Tax=Paenibacillus gallinarum TaxID=2762232 RepID=A0ABR8T4B6_9BACL|nr:AraC family transcriptional regulator [Paenibacillus gallinarum]MBD7970557.1 helix-turn-helix transcriptional regulator [Paenibacillus gallinarum]